MRTLPCFAAIAAVLTLAGNSLARPFEVDLQRPVTRQVPEETIALPFEVK